MSRQNKLSAAELVSNHIHNLDPDLGKIVEAMQQIILSSHKEIGERIK